MGNNSGKGSKKKGAKSKPHKKAKFRATPVYLKFYADTNHTGRVDESDEEWKNRKKPPGAILMCAGIADDHRIMGYSELMVKQKENLPENCKAYLALSASDAEKVNIYEDLEDRVEQVLGNGDTEYQMERIRDRNYKFTVEATTPVLESGEETVEVHAVIRKDNEEKFNDHVLFTIAPWLMLSNIEEVEEAYVARCWVYEPDENQWKNNLEFRKALRRILGGKLKGFPPKTSADVEQWMQDIIEIGFVGMPGDNRMHQFMNSDNVEGRDTREALYLLVESHLTADDCGHIEIAQNPWKSMASFGNLEITPPLEKYRFGRIYYGVRDPGYSPNNEGGEMTPEVVEILQANKKYQAPVEVPTNWLTVGHVDEFLSFVPDLAPGSSKPYKLLMVSPQVAYDLCKELQGKGQGGSVICEGKGGGYEITVDDFLRKGSDLLKTNKAINKLLKKIKKKVRKEFGLSRSDIVEIPVIFNGDPLKKGKVENAIARTAGMVNCLVAKPDVIVPKPFGPKDASKGPPHPDVFEEDAREKLEALGLDIHFVDDWDVYHKYQGEIHCGTNAKRVPPDDWDWWNEK